jgi:pantoate--beta-alanine ligase
MVVVTDKKTLSSEILSRKQNDKKSGFVPTMGALHKGHLALVERALKENDFVVVSIYVNPTQFDNATDLDTYPRLLDQDRELLQKLNGDIVLFVPANSDIYGDDMQARHFNFGGIEFQMEGKHRSGHFDGVGTVVSILLKLVTPDRAYFGEKDFQQLQIIRELVRMEKLNVQIVGCPIVREPSGLAMSSRNKRLSTQQQKDATLIFRTLSEIKRKFKTHSISSLNAIVKERFLKDDSMKLEYFQIAEEGKLTEVKRKRNGNHYRAFIAAFCGEVRLIDNMPLN